MRDLVILFIHLLMTVARLASPGGVRSVVAESCEQVTNYMARLAQLDFEAASRSNLFEPTLDKRGALAQ